MNPAADAPSRPSRRPRDLALSLLVLLLPIALLVGVYRVLHQGEEPVLVDAAPVVERARAAGDFPVAEPTGLADGWRTLTARYVAGDGQAVLRIGYLTPSGAGVQLVESDRPADALLGAELTSSARPEGTRSVDGRDWQRYAGRPGERALVLLEPERTLLVVGAAGEEELAELAASLR
ncbi:MAG TPA: DUF4245 domain-containing protein [Micromonosporaceae bacterium]|nr:DUF4245 domain-containing protein [Micromonosporaceae bacterium]